MKPDHINQLLPASLDSERALLCSFCVDPQGGGALFAERGIGPDHFTNPIHSSLSECMMSRWTEGRPVNMRLLMKDMEDMEDAVDTAVRTSEILTHISTAAYMAEYADRVIEKFQLREIIVRTGKIFEAAWLHDANPSELIAEASKLATLSTPPSGEKSFKELILDKLRRMEEGEPNDDMIPTGIALLDRQSPLRLGDMPLISGEKKIGKSILALSIATNVLMDGNAVLYFSLEDSSAKVIDRIFAGASRLPISNHHLKNLTEGEIQRATRAAHELSGKKMVLRDNVQDLLAMVAVIRQTKAKIPELVLAVVDYAQLVRCKVAKGANREQEVAAVSRTLRLLSIELKIAIIVLCQLNKEGDTRESKALEQDATAMWKLIPADGDEHNKRMLVIPFQRNGDGNIAFPVTFFGHIARVENCSDEKP
jgi:replicative DNA helicase